MNGTRWYLVPSISALSTLSLIAALGCGDDGGIGNSDGGSGGQPTSTTGAGADAGSGGETGGDGGGTTELLYGIEVDVSGLDGSLVLALAPDGPPVTIESNGKHKIDANLEDGQSFEVEVRSAPGLQTCRAATTTGVIDGADAIGISFDCTDQLVFVGNDASPADFELWATDGTDAGPRQIKNISLNASSRPRSLIDAPGSRIFFTADDGEHGRELWISDGTDTGTHIVRDIFPGSSDAYIDELHLRGDKVYFAAEDPMEGYELWVSDGSEAGTLRVSNINPGGDSSPSQLTTLGARLLFVADDDTTQQLYALEADGSTITALGPAVDEPIVVGADGRAYFVGWDESFGTELYVTDGTPLGTARLSDVSAGPLHSDPEPLAGLPGALLFAAQESTMGTELYVTDGTATSLVGDLWSGPQSSYPTLIGVVDNKALIALDDGAVDHELWVSDGTLAGTSLLADVTPGGPSYFDRYAVDGTTALLVVYNSSNNTSALWHTDGTASGTAVLKSFPLGTYPAQYLGRLVDKHCFAVSSAELGGEPWCTDGTEAGTTLLIDLCPGTCSSIPIAG